MATRTRVAAVAGCLAFALGICVSLPAQTTPSVTLGQYVFDSQLFGDSLIESDGGAYRSRSWLNIIRADPGNPAALTGAHFDTGIANIGRGGGITPIYTIGYNTPILNRAGPDLAIVSVRFSLNDSFDLAVSADGTTFTAFMTFGPQIAVDTGESRTYYFGGDPTGGPFTPKLFVTPVDLSVFGIALGDSIKAARITSSPEGDLIRVAGFAGNRVTFDIAPTSTEKVLAHKYAQNDSYFSSYQSSDGQITISGIVNDPAGAPAAGIQLYLRVIDPPDTSAYVPAASKQPNDNADPADQSGANLNARLSTTSVTSGSNGRFSVTLTVSDRYAGDNYKVEASFDQAFSCAPPNGPSRCAQTGLIEVWKRVYVEYDRMFRRGAYLADDVPACPVGPCVLKLDAVDGMHKGITLRMMHAPSSLIVGPQLFYTEDVKVVRVDRKKKQLEVTPFQKPYFGPNSDADDNGATQPFLADAVGIVTGDDAKDFFIANTQFIGGLFDGTFVDHVYLQDDPVPYLPFEETLLGGGNGGEAREIAEKWFFNFARPNHQHLLTAEKHFDPDQQGVTTAAIGTNFSWIFVETVTASSPKAGGGEWLFNGEVTAHEMAHQWRVNSLQSGGHCVHFRWNSSTFFCSMHGDYGVAAEPCHGTCPEFYDGQVGFHFQTAADSEYITVRRRTEPVPQN